MKHRAHTLSLFINFRTFFSMFLHLARVFDSIFFIALGARINKKAADFDPQKGERDHRTSKDNLAWLGNLEERYSVTPDFDLLLFRQSQPVFATLMLRKYSVY